MKLDVESAVVSLAIAMFAKEIQEDLGDIRLSEVILVLFKFGKTVLHLHKNCVKWEIQSTCDREQTGEKLTEKGVAGRNPTSNKIVVGFPMFW